MKSKSELIDEIDHLRGDAAGLYKAANEMLIEAKTLENDAQERAIELILNHGLLRDSEWRLSRHSIEQMIARRPIILEGSNIKFWDDILNLLEPEWEHWGWDIADGVRLRLDGAHVTLQFADIEMLYDFNKRYQIPIYLEELYDFIDEAEGMKKKATELLGFLLRNKEDKIIEELGYD